MAKGPGGLDGGILTDTSGDTVDHVTRRSMETRMQVAVFSTFLHGIFALQSNESVWAGAMLKILVEGNIECVSQIGSIFGNEILYFLVFLGSVATCAAVLALKFTRAVLCSSIVVVEDRILYFELAVSTVVSLGTSTMIIPFFWTFAVVGAKGYFCGIIVVADRGTLDLAVASALERLYW